MTALQKKQATKRTLTKKRAAAVSLAHRVKALETWCRELARAVDTLERKATSAETPR